MEVRGLNLIERARPSPTPTHSHSLGYHAPRSAIATAASIPATRPLMSRRRLPVDPPPPCQADSPGPPAACRGGLLHTATSSTAGASPSAPHPRPSVRSTPSAPPCHRTSVRLTLTAPPCPDVLQPWPWPWSGQADVMPPPRDPPSCHLSRQPPQPRSAA
jgi:hypothetical protein